MDHGSSCAHSSSFIFFAPFNHVRLEALACAPRTCCGLSRRQFRGEDRDFNFAMDLKIDFCGWRQLRGEDRDLKGLALLDSAEGTMPSRHLFDWGRFCNHAPQIKNIFTKHCRVRIFTSCAMTRVLPTMCVHIQQLWRCQAMELRMIRIFKVPFSSVSIFTRDSRQTSSLTSCHNFELDKCNHTVEKKLWKWKVRFQINCKISPKPV